MHCRPRLRRKLIDHRTSPRIVSAIYAGSVSHHQDARLNFAGLLLAVENASPVAAADVLADRLAHALGASGVAFLVADFSGRALVRLGHAGSPSDLCRAVALLASEKPDLILMGGDFASESPRYAEQAAGAVAPLVEAARLGAYAVLGNHDMECGAKKVTAALEDRGVQVLRNESVAIETGNGTLWIAGVDEITHFNHDARATFAQIPLGAAVLALWHEPDFAEQAAERGAFAQVSGHTHGGQIRFPFIGPLVLPRFGRRFIRGKFSVDGMTLYVSRGAGVYRPPVRFRCPPEVTLITLDVSRGC